MQIILSFLGEVLKYVFVIYLPLTQFMKVSLVHRKKQPSRNTVLSVALVASQFSLELLSTDKIVPMKTLDSEFWILVNTG